MSAAQITVYDGPAHCTLRYGRTVHILGGARPGTWGDVRTLCGVVALDSEWSRKRATCRRCVRIQAKATGGGA